MLKDYFAGAEGTGYLATADESGQVDIAVFARPHVLAENTIGFIMTDHLTHHNLTVNPYAAYLFAENGSRTKGMRLMLRKVSEEKNSELLHQLHRRPHNQPDIDHFLVVFSVEKILPLVGAGQSSR